MNETSRTWPEWAPRMPLFKHKCPRCTSTEFKAAESRPFDYLLTLFLLVPVRCKVCWRRFYWVSFSGALPE
jgi:hypothetical protein